MNKKLILIAAGVVAAIGSLTGLGVVYARFNKANKAIKTTTIGELLRKDNPTPDESPVIDEEMEVGNDTFAEKVVEAAENLEAAGKVISQDVESRPILKEVKKSKENKEGKNDATDNTPTEGN